MHHNRGPPVSHAPRDPYPSSWTEGMGVLDVDIQCLKICLQKPHSVELFLDIYIEIILY